MTKKIGLIIKQEEEKVLKDKLKSAESFLLVKYSGLSASDLNALRSSLSGAGSSLMVFKNSVSKRVFKSYQDFNAQVSGPCGLVFISEDLISASQVLHKFIKEKPNLEIKTGFLKDRVLTAKEIGTLSKIPSLPILYSQLVGGLKSPIFSMVFSLKQILNKLVWALGQIKDKKGG